MICAFSNAQPLVPFGVLLQPELVHAAPILAGGIPAKAVHGLLYRLDIKQVRQHLYIHDSVRRQELADQVNHRGYGVDCELEHLDDQCVEALVELVKCMPNWLAKEASNLEGRGEERSEQGGE